MLDSYVDLIAGQNIDVKNVVALHDYRYGVMICPAWMRQLIRICLRLTDSRRRQPVRRLRLIRPCER